MRRQESRRLAAVRHHETLAGAPLQRPHRTRGKVEKERRFLAAEALADQAQALPLPDRHGLECALLLRHHPANKAATRDFGNRSIRLRWPLFSPAFLPKTGHLAVGLITTTIAATRQPVSSTP